MARRGRSVLLGVGSGVGECPGSSGISLFPGVKGAVGELELIQVAERVIYSLLKQSHPRASFARGQFRKARVFPETYRRIERRASGITARVGSVRTSTGRGS